MSGIGINIDPIAAYQNYRAAKDTKQAFATRIQTTVADAKAAGVHPLFALGANVNSPSFSGGSGTSSVSADFMSRAEKEDRSSRNSQAAQSHAQSLRESEARIRESNARAALDESELVQRQAMASNIARKTQAVNSQQDIVKVPASLKSVPPRLPLAPAATADLAGRPLQVPGHRTDLKELAPYYGDELTDVFGLQNYLADEVFPYLLGTPGEKRSSGLYRDLDSMAKSFIDGLMKEARKKQARKGFNNRR